MWLAPNLWFGISRSVSPHLPSCVPLCSLYEYFVVSFLAFLTTHLRLEQKKMPSVVINAAIATVIFAPSISAAAQPQVVRWSGNSYGPDGPWGAVTVEIGTPAKSVDLLPGGSWMTNILSVHICKNSIGCPAEKAGLYDFLESSSFTQIGATGDLKDNFDENPGSLSAITEGEAGWVFDDLT